MPSNAEEEATERALVQVHELTWALRSVQRLDPPVGAVMARRLGIGHTDLQALMLVGMPPTGLGPVELGALLGMRSASATALVDRLEAAGHVRRARHPTDRRRVVVEPTDSARRAIIGTLAPLLADLEDVAEEFTDAEAAVVLRYLRRAGEVMERFAGG